MQHLTFTILSLIGISLLLPIFAEADSKEPNYVAQLKLSNDQLKKLSQYNMDYQIKMRSINGNLQLIALEIQDELKKTDPNCTVLEKLIEKRKENRELQRITNAEFLIKLKGLLTPAQLKRFNELRLTKKIILGN